MNGFKIILYVIFGIYGGILGLVLSQIIYYVIALFISIRLWQYETKNPN